MLKVLGRANSANVQKVVWALAEMDQAFERIDVGGRFGGNREPGYLALNPHGVVPTLIDDDHAVWESNTILRYLARRFGPTPLYPEGAAARAAVECWMDWQLGTLNAGITPLFWALVRTPEPQRDRDLIERHRQRAEAALAVLDGVMNGRRSSGPFLCGANLTLADIAIAPQVHRWFEMPIERAELPALARWHERLRQRPAFVQHVAIGLS